MSVISESRMQLASSRDLRPVVTCIVRTGRSKMVEPVFAFGVAAFAPQLIMQSLDITTIKVYVDMAKMRVVMCDDSAMLISSCNFTGVCVRFLCGSFHRQNFQYFMLGARVRRCEEVFSLCRPPK